MLQPFEPPAVLRSCHLQTLASQWPLRRRRIRRDAHGLLRSSAALTLDCGAGVRLRGFLGSPSGPSRGLVVLLHGWEGSASSSYVLSAASALLQAGYSVFRLNFRDHGDTHGLNEGLFHSCRIDEVFNAVRAIRERMPDGVFAIVGQSLGGNFALRIAARAQQAGLHIDRVIAVCPVLEPSSTMEALDQGPGIYRRYFLARWRSSLRTKAALFPELYGFGNLGRFRTLSAMTEYFVETYTEFDSLGRYLSGYAITGNALAGLGVSSRMIVALDDPVIPAGDLAHVADSPLLERSLLDYGGHCGFIDNWLGPSWVDREIVEDLERLS